MDSKPTPCSDADLVAACVRGDEAAWAELVERYSRLVYSIPVRHRLPADVCEEVFQSVWAIAVRHLGSLRDAQTLAAWLIRTTQRETWRAARVRRGVGGPETSGDLVWSDPEEAEMLEDRQRVREAFGRLDERCRLLLTALFREDRPDYDQIAAQIGMPRGSIGPTRGRCLEKLRGLLSGSADPGCS